MNANAATASGCGRSSPTASTASPWRPWSTTRSSACTAGCRRTSTAWTRSGTCLDPLRYPRVGCCAIWCGPIRRGRFEGGELMREGFRIRLGRIGLLSSCGSMISI
ncbi:unnamed protein product [Linum tenue]|uniref:Uncharacterized protein n=1 Tax=Linum tenue TaxID=586396 RepID=A0AAV0NHN5_9ROSI|nr:unnamed protein product [Linum tenue]